MQYDDKVVKFCFKNVPLNGVKIIILGLVTLNKSNSDLRHGRYTK